VDSIHTIRGLRVGVLNRLAVVKIETFFDRCNSLLKLFAHQVNVPCLHYQAHAVNEKQKGKSKGHFESRLHAVSPVLVSGKIHGAFDNIKKHYYIMVS
jgi:hypothetical protein